MAGTRGQWRTGGESNVQQLRTWGIPIDACRACVSLELAADLGHPLRLS